MDEVIKVCAKYLVVVPVIANLWVLYRSDMENKARHISTLIGGGILALIFAALAAHFITDTRPQYKDGSTPLIAHGNDNGFPSDHTLLAAFLAFVVLPYGKKLSYGLMLVALVVAWARVAAHVHHAVDVVGSIIIAALAFYLVNWVYESKVAKTSR